MTLAGSAFHARAPATRNALSGEAMSRDRWCQKPPTDPRMLEQRNLHDPEPAKCPPLLRVWQFLSSDELCMQTVTMASTQTTSSRIAYVWRPDVRVVWTRRRFDIGRYDRASDGSRSGFFKSGVPYAAVLWADVNRPNLTIKQIKFV